MFKTMSEHLNIVNPDAIERYLTGPLFARLADDVKALFVPLCLRLIKRQTSNKNGQFRDFIRLKKLPEKSPLWLQQAWDRAVRIHTFHPSDKLLGDLKVIGFWLEKACQRQELWTKSEQAFSKRAAFSSLNGAVMSARHELKIWGYETELYERLGDLKIVHRYADGSFMVEMLTPEEMDRDGKKNQICVGGNSEHARNHKKHLIEFRVRFFSLRDRSNDTHATLKLDENGTVTEVKGKQNAPVSQKYDPYILEFVNQSPFIKSVSPGPIVTGIYTHNGRYYSYRRLPPGLTFESLDLALTEGVILPETMYVKKELCLNGRNPPSLVPAGVMARNIHLDWKIRLKGQWGWGLHRDDGPARLIFDSGKKLSRAEFFLNDKKQARTLSDQELHSLEHPLVFEETEGSSTPKPGLPVPCLGR